MGGFHVLCGHRSEIKFPTPDGAYILTSADNETCAALTTALFNVQLLFVQYMVPAWIAQSLS
jgi:hypothetical protein